MAPLAETMATGPRLRAAVQRSRSLNSLEMGFDAFATAAAVAADEQSIDPFAESFGDFDRFDDVMKAQRQAKFIASLNPDPSSKVQFDCFGFSLFDLEADSASVAPTQVQVKPILTQEEEKKAARRARRRRSTLTIRSNTGLPRHSRGASPRHSRGVSPGSLRRRRSTKTASMDSSAPEQGAYSWPREGPSRMRRSKSHGDGGLETLAKRMDQSTKNDTAKRRRRSKSSEKNGGISSSLHHQLKTQEVKSRKRHSGTRKQRSASDAGREMMMMMMLDMSSNTLDSTETEHLLEDTSKPEIATTKPHRRSRSGSRHRSLRKQITHPSNKSSIKSSQHGGTGTGKGYHHLLDASGTGGRERRRSRRSEIDDSTCPGTHKRRGLSLTSLTSALLEHNTNNLLVSTSNFHF